MFAEFGYLGCPCGVGEIRALNDKLNTEVVEHVSDCQELVMLNNFARECNEDQFKKCLHERLTDIASWRWVLEDLAKRLDEAIAALNYEHNALRVVVGRIQREIDEYCRNGSRPGAFCPLSDPVEEAIIEEHNFLRDHKKKFENMIPDLEKEIKALKKTKTRINTDIVRKQQAMSVDEACGNINVNNTCRLDCVKKKKKKMSPVIRWEKKCAALKVCGLSALSNAAVVRQQVRGARTHLSIAAQAYAARADSALRRRLHSNKIKLQDLKWQREEALRDYNSLEEELTEVEHNLIKTMEQERMIESRLLDRTLRPIGELIKDEVDRKLRDELGRLRNFSKQLRTNMERITSLQNHLVDSMTQGDCCAEDLVKVIRIDEERIMNRQGEVPQCTCCSSGTVPALSPAQANGTSTQSSTSRSPSESGLTSIREEDEDDYPFDQ